MSCAALARQYFINQFIALCIDRGTSAEPTAETSLVKAFTLKPADGFRPRKRLDFMKTYLRNSVDYKLKWP